ncbi:acetylcholinesterase-like [Dermacentor albipictus]|uniref:acetylcholinesterase-like n=1 Tax=Dermacentor albipictus TaxID=60249 RepID=UPI0031FD7F69
MEGSEKAKDEQRRQSPEQQAHGSGVSRPGTRHGSRSRSPAARVDLPAPGTTEASHEDGIQQQQNRSQAMEGSENVKGEERRTSPERQVHTLRVRTERKASGSKADSSRLDTRSRSRSRSRAARVHSPAARTPHASPDDGIQHEPGKAHGPDQVRSNEDHSKVAGTSRGKRESESSTMLEGPNKWTLLAASLRQKSLYSTSILGRKTTESTSQQTGIRYWWRRLWGESENRSHGVSYLIRIYERERTEKLCRLVYACLFALFLTLFAYFMASALRSSTTVRLRTEVGLVSGQQHWVLGKSVYHYLGLPYAFKPARFQRASPLDLLQPNTVVKQHPNIRCMQPVGNWLNVTWPKSAELVYGPASKTRYSEDCLYVNVWSPVQPCDYTSSSCAPSAPVLVVLFSKGFFQGGADWYDGSLLASLGGIVVVAPNFRLGPLAVPLKGEENELKDMPLLSMADQLLAIKWTWHNIKHFGGNTSHITLLGAGGGAWTVGEMLFSNRESVRDIIQRVILHGGSPLQRYAPFRPYLVEKAMGCEPGATECLDIADAALLADLASHHLRGPPATITKAEARPGSRFEILVGYAAGEGRKLSFDLSHDIVGDGGNEDSSEEQKLAKLGDYLELTDLAAPYFHLRNNSAAGSNIWPAFMEDLLVRCPIELFSHLYHSMYATVYGFVYEGESEYPWNVPETRFPDLDLLFGVPLISSDPVYPEHMKQTSLKFMRVWSTFIKTGRLPTINGYPWPLMIEDSRWTATSVIIRDGMKLSAPTRFVQKRCELIDAILMKAVKEPGSDSNDFATED